MNPLRRQRLFLVLFLVLGATAAVGVTLAALRENLNAFYPPAQIKDGSAPQDVRIRAGGMVKAGSIKRASDKLLVSFVLTDFAGAEFTVDYEGILPDLFGEGQGVMATGMLAADGHFKAQEVLAKHDENYHPPELAGMPKSAPVGPPADVPIGAPAAAPSAAIQPGRAGEAAPAGASVGTREAPVAKPETPANKAIDMTLPAITLPAITPPAITLPAITLPARREGQSATGGSVTTKGAHAA